MKENKLPKFLEDWQGKAVCLLIGIFTYFLFSYYMTVTRTVTVPLKVILPSGYTATSNIPPTVDVEIHGTEDRVYMINMDKITVSADFSDVDSEGISTALVTFDFNGMDDIISFAKVSFSATPGKIRVYFAENGKDVK